MQSRLRHPRSLCLRRSESYRYYLLSQRSNQSHWLAVSDFGDCCAFSPYWLPSLLVTKQTVTSESPYDALLTDSNDGDVDGEREGKRDWERDERVPSAMSQGLTPTARLEDLQAGAYADWWVH